MQNEQKLTHYGDITKTGGKLLVNPAPCYAAGGDKKYKEYATEQLIVYALRKNL